MSPGLAKSGSANFFPFLFSCGGKTKKVNPWQENGCNTPCFKEVSDGSIHFWIGVASPLSSANMCKGNATEANLDRLTGILNMTFALTYNTNLNVAYTCKIGKKLF